MILVCELWLLPWATSIGEYAAVIAAVPEAAGAVKVVEHEALPVELWTSVHGEPVRDPDTPASEMVTVPVGVSGEPKVEPSDTVAVHVEPWFTKTGDVQTTAVVVGRNPTVNENPGLRLEL